MSFAYLPLYTGDYLRDTRGLSMAGHGCYILLLCYCWDTRGPLPLDTDEIATIAGAHSQEERKTLERVVNRYFTRVEDGWYNARMDREIARANAISGARSSAGRKGYQAKAKQVLSKCLASATIPTTNTIPAPPPTPGRSKPTSAMPTDLAVPADLWQQFRENRRSLKAPMTDHAETLLAKKLQALVRSGQNGVKVVEQSIERGWKGLFAVDAQQTKAKTQAEKRAVVNAAIWGDRSKDDDAIDGTIID